MLKPNISFNKKGDGLKEITNKNINWHEEDLKLTFDQIDCLMELGNIGSGNAITAFSQLLNRKIEVSLTSAEVIPFWELPNKFENLNSKVFGIISSVNGEHAISILQIFTKESIINIINNLCKKNSKIIQNINELKDLDEFTFSIISEIGNILSGHYASALADLMKIKLIPDVPDIAFDRISAIIDGLIASSSEFGDFIVVIDTNLSIEDLDLDGLICFFPTVETLKKLFEALNIEYSF